jgi:hypothetical protein
MTRLPLLALLLPLAACGGEAPAPAPSPTASAGGYIAQVKALPEGQQRGVLFRAIRDGAKACPELSSFEAAPDQDGKPVWNAVCSDGGRWRVVLSDDGTALVTGAAPR